MKKLMMCVSMMALFIGVMPTTVYTVAKKNKRSNAQKTLKELQEELIFKIDNARKIKNAFSAGAWLIQSEALFEELSKRFPASSAFIAKEYDQAKKVVLVIVDQSPHKKEIEQELKKNKINLEQEIQKLVNIKELPEVMKFYAILSEAKLSASIPEIMSDIVIKQLLEKLIPAFNALSNIKNIRESSVYDDIKNDYIAVLSKAPHGHNLYAIAQKLDASELAQEIKKEVERVSEGK